MCQVHIAAAALVQSGWLNGALCSALIEKAAQDIGHRQQRIVAARESNTKRTRKQLRKMGIYLKDLIRCKWP